MADAQEKRQVNLAAYDVQIAYCEANDAPVTARICRAIASNLDETTQTGRRIWAWEGNPVADGLVLRSAAAFHALVQSGRTPELQPVYSGEETGADVIAARIGEVLQQYDAEICDWLDTPPQTNEPGRSAALMCGLKILADRYQKPLEILEIGSSAGLNLAINRYSFDLAGSMAGPEGSPVHIKPEWRGDGAPPAIRPDIISTRGADIDPMYIADPQTEERLLAYIWPEHELRFERTAKAIQMIKEKPVALEGGDAADWVEAQLAKPQARGTMRVLMHSIMWQYLPESAQQRIFDAMTAAGANASASEPLGWVSLEANRTLNKHELRVSSWPDHHEPIIYARSHAHGFWVEWLG